MKTDDNTRNISLTIHQVTARPERVAFRQERVEYPKAGAAVDDWATPSFLRREYMIHMDWIVGPVAEVHHWNGITGAYVVQQVACVTRRHTARAIRQRARCHRRRLGDETAGMGTKALQRGIAKLRARKGNL